MSGIIKLVPKSGELSNHQQIEQINEQLRETWQVRQRTLEQLEKFADQADQIYVNKNKKEMGGSLAGVAGGVLTTAGGVVTLATGGLAAPLVLTGLAASGAAAGICGGGFNVYTSFNASQEEAKLMETLKRKLKEDIEAKQKLEDALDAYTAENPTLETSYDLYYNGARIVGSAVHFETVVLGTNFIITTILNKILPSLLLSRMSGLSEAAAPILETLFKELQEASSQISQGVAKEAAKGASKEITNAFSTNYINRISKKAAEHALKEAGSSSGAASAAAAEAAAVTSKEVARASARDAAREAAKAATAKVLKESGEEVSEALLKASAKRAAKEAAQQVAKNSAIEATEEVTKAAAKTAAKLTLVFGVLSVGWDGYNAAKSWRNASEGRSQLGEEIRRIITDLQPRQDISM